MGARKKGRSLVTYAGRNYLWYMDDYSLRIASEDKRFAVAYGWNGTLLVSGQEFPGISPQEKRPVRVAVPQFTSTGMKTRVRKIIRWSLRSDREIHRIEPPSRFDVKAT
jgi:hypothetical protein